MCGVDCRMISSNGEGVTNGRDHDKWLVRRRHRQASPIKTGSQGEGGLGFILGLLASSSY